MKRNALLVGSFLTVAITLIIVGIIWLGGSAWFEQRAKAVIYFVDGVSGLYVGAPVTFRGVQVGEVQDIDLQINPQTREAHMPVTISLRTQALHVATPHQSLSKPLDIPMLVSQGLRAKLVAQSFVTGQKMIDLDLSPDQPAVLLGPQLRTTPPEIPTQRGVIDALLEQAGSVDIRAVVAELRGTLQSVNKTLNSANKLLTETQSQVSQTSLQAQKTLDSASSSLKAVQSQTVGVLKSAQVLTEQSSRILQTAQSPMMSAIDSARAATDSAKLAADSAQRTMLHVDEFLAPDSPMRSDINAMLRDMGQTTRHLRDWSQTIADQPNAIIFGQQP